MYFARYSAKKAHKQIRRFGDSKVDKGYCLNLHNAIALVWSTQHLFQSIVILVIININSYLHNSDAEKQRKWESNDDQKE